MKMFPCSRDHFLFVFFFVCFFIQADEGFYVPGVAPVDFKEGEEIEVKAIKLTSMMTVVPYEYYSLPFCRPKGEIHYKSENLGEVMRGDRIVNTPFKINMKKDIRCATTCTAGYVNLNREELASLKRRIREEYRVHLLIDNLPCATTYKTNGANGPLYENGYRLGWSKDLEYYVHNHLAIVLKYHEPAHGLYRVVGFEITPRSIQEIETRQDEWCTILNDSIALRVGDTETRVPWTYSVKWVESDIPWASRWDTYLSINDVQIHWFSILNSAIVIVCLSGIMGVIIVRTVRRDIAHYNSEENMEHSLEETGWKLIHGDVFRPPRRSMLLVNFVGTGIQLVGMVAVTVFFAMLGMLSPASRGSLMSAAIFLYCFMGAIAGYYSGRLYRTFRGSSPKLCAFWTAVLYPSINLGIGFILNFFLIGKRSSGAIPFTTMIALLFLWFGVDLPLVFLGFHFGFRKQQYYHPVRTNQIPRQVPDQPWYLHTFPCMMFAGILPFGTVFIELFFILSAIWENHFYYLFGFLFIVCVILFISCSQISILFAYFLLCAENYHWWWKAFVISGGSAVYVMGYSIFYFFTKLNIVGFIPMLLYFSYSFLIALAFWILTGTIGFYSAYSFICRIYAAVKID